MDPWASTSKPSSLEGQQLQMEDCKKVTQKNVPISLSLPSTHTHTHATTHTHKHMHSYTHTQVFLC